MRPAHWLPPVAWMALILAFSSDAGGAHQTGRFLEPLLAWLAPGAQPAQVDAVHVLLRKAGHVTAYAILAALWVRGLVAGRGLAPGPAAAAAVAIAVAWALVDEGRQALTTTRTGSLGDVAIDAAGALLGASATAAGWQRAVGVATTALLWVAALGGAGALLVDAVTGVAAGVLWVTAPAAALLLVLRHRRARAG